jgi:hypothetical protein
MHFGRQRSTYTAIIAVIAVIAIIAVIGGLCHVLS